MGSGRTPAAAVALDACDITEEMKGTQANRQVKMKKPSADDIIN
jgi:hypothetical protein